MLDHSAKYGTTSLSLTVLTSGLLPLVPALLPLATTSLTGRQPYGFTMFWTSPASLLFLVLLGAALGVATFWIRRSGTHSSRPSVFLRILCGLAGFTLAPLPALLEPDAASSYAVLFLAPSLAMTGVAFAWRLRQWPATVRYLTTLVIGIIDAEWVIGMLQHAPPHLAILTGLAIPVALICFGAKVWAVFRHGDN